MTEGWVITHKTGSRGSRLWRDYNAMHSWVSLDLAYVWPTEQAARDVAAYWHVVMPLSEARMLVQLEAL